MSTNKKMLRRSLTVLSLVGALGLSSCVKDLDRFPSTGETSVSVYGSADKTFQALAKVYGAFALTGNSGDGEGSDLNVPDQGESGFVRNFFVLQELPTETAVCAWGDGGLQDINKSTWNATNKFVELLYNRSFYQIKLASAFLKNTEDKKNDATMRTYRAEARFLRAYQYWVLLDLYGNPPFIDETMGTGKIGSRQISRADLFTYIEKELKEIEGDLKDPKTNDYGRADKATAWALLSRLYLNSEVYTGTAHYDKAAEYAEKVIASGKYNLKSDYDQLFMADNDKNNPEVLLSVNFDGAKSQSYSGTTYIVNASIGGESANVTHMPMGVTGGWWGNRATKAMLALFGENATSDKRALMKPSATPEISNLGDFNQGVYVYKFRNVTSTGANGSDGNHCDIDFPLFRLSELYLTYAEAAIRGAADQTKALGYLNKVRERAHATTYDHLPNLDELLKELGREFYWEGHRRTDLIRFGKFTSGDYLWPWKGGVQAGKALDAKYNLYPIPAVDHQANIEHLKQNTGY
ncbi:RagB/SusD family nutrient uptake outer membrane protein [Porphyromonas sp.]